MDVFFGRKSFRDTSIKELQNEPKWFVNRRGAYTNSRTLSEDTTIGDLFDSKENIYCNEYLIIVGGRKSIMTELLRLRNAPLRGRLIGRGIHSEYEDLHIRIAEYKFLRTYTVVLALPAMRNAKPGPGFHACDAVGTFGVFAKVLLLQTDRFKSVAQTFRSVLTNSEIKDALAN